MKIAPTLNDLLFIISYDNPNHNEDTIIICDADGSNTPLPAWDISFNEFIDDIVTAPCGFILLEENSSASCSDLQCDDNTVGEESVSTIHDLKWCPGTVETSHDLYQFPQCCFHPSSRALMQDDLWNCILTYYNPPHHDEPGLLEAQYDYTEVYNEDTQTSENTKQILPTLNDLLYLASNGYPAPDDIDGDYITICSDGSNETPPQDNVPIDSIINAACGFILLEEDSSASCSNLQCDDGTTTTATTTTTTAMGEEPAAVSTLASWNLKWCPRRIGPMDLLRTFPQCCFHPSIRARTGMALWGCLWTYAWLS